MAPSPPAPSRAPSKTAKTSGVRTATRGVTSRMPGWPWTPASGVTRSPRPSTSAGPPTRKNGTSEPIIAAAFRRRSASTASRAPHASRAASNAAAASDEPPPRPAATGIRFSSRAASGGVGGLPGPWPIAVARGGDRAEHEVLVDRPGVAARDVQRVASACHRPGPALSRSCRPSGTNTEWRSWNPSSRRPTTARVRFELRRREPDDRACDARRRSCVADRPRRSWPIGAERLAQREPLPDRQRLRPAIGRDAGRCQRGIDARERRPAAGGSARCGSSCVARGRPPGRAATARPPRPGRAGRPRRTARPR